MYTHIYGGNWRKLVILYTIFSRGQCATINQAESIKSLKRELMEQKRLIETVVCIPRHLS